MTRFDPILHFVSLEFTVFRLRAKFEVASFNGSRDIRVVQKFQNWVMSPLHDPFWPNFAFFFVRTHRHPSPCQIWSF